MIGQLGGQLTVDVGPIDARLLEQRPGLEHACYTASASGPLPCVCAKLFRTISIGESATDVGLKLVEELRCAIEEVRHARMLPS